MPYKTILLFACLLAACKSESTSTADEPSSPEPTETGYVKPVYEELPLGAIKPKGWLLSQLEIMRDGTHRSS